MSKIKHALSGPLAALARRRQFVVYQLVPSSTRAGKMDKLPVDSRTGCLPPPGQGGAAIWTDAESACKAAEGFGQSYGVGYSFDDSDPFFFLDIDNCLQTDKWSPLALNLCELFSSAYIEVSQSNNGLHIIGTYSGGMPLHGCKNAEYGLELYHTARFVALTGTRAIGSAATDCTSTLPGVIDQYFTPSLGGETVGTTAWTTVPCKGWSGPRDDKKLIELALASNPSANAKFGDGATFADLWENNVVALKRAYPDHYGNREYDASSADAALAAHLAYWTGKDCERMKRLMELSALSRDKWHRPDYLSRTISKAVARQVDVFSERSHPIVMAAGQVLTGFSAPTGDVRDGTGTTRPLTKLGNAHRMYDRYGDTLRYVFDVARWMLWDGNCWRWDMGDAGIRSKAASLANVIYDEACDHPAHIVEFAKWSRKSQTNITISSTIKLLSDFEHMRLPLACIDAEQLSIGLNHAKQIIDLRTGAVQTATPSDYVTKSLGAETIGDAAKALRWHAFMVEIFDGDYELINWMQRFCGYLLTGSTQEHIFLFCFGHGANGKSVFVEILKFLLGDYARPIAPETLADCKRQAGGATPDLAALVGSRLVISAETEDNMALAESLIKSLVSGDTISTRELYKAPMQFNPTFKLVMCGNHKPVVKGNDNGIWRRVRLVPFNRTFTTEQRDPHLLAKLKAEGPHILAWMVAGCLEWQLRGLIDTPAIISKATEEYRTEQDIFGDWLAQRCNLGPGHGETSSSELYANYHGWCGANGLKPLSSHYFGRRLSDRGFKSRRTNGDTMRAEISLLNPFDTGSAASAAQPRFS